MQPPRPPKYKISHPPWLGSIANIVQQRKYYYHAKFGAFTPKCTIFSPYGLRGRSPTARVTRFAFFAGSVHSLSHIPSTDFSPNQRTFTSIVAFFLSPAAFLPFLLISTTYFSLFSVSFVLIRGIPDKITIWKVSVGRGGGSGGCGATTGKAMQHIFPLLIWFPSSYSPAHI